MPLGSLVGFVTNLGIAARNGIRHLQEHEGMTFGRGLFTSTVLNLFLLPAIFLKYGVHRPAAPTVRP